jgi:hypothetical protein
MGQIFTINLAGSKFHFQLIKLNQKIDRSVESQVLVQGNTITLCKNAQGSWQQKEASSPVLNELIQAIGNTITLRYRI